MWHVDSVHNSLITTGNGGSETTKAQVSLFYNGGKSQYRLEKVLAPGQQLLLDVGQLVHNQVPDSDGNVIPAETMTGSYELRDLDHPAVGLLYEGKLTIDKTYGHASYGCGTCCGLYNPKLDPNPFNGPQSIYNQDYYLALEQCGGQWEDWTGTAYSWQSSNTAVATLPNSVLYTVAVGSATGSAQNMLQATHPAPRCPVMAMQGSQLVTVVAIPVNFRQVGPGQNVNGVLEFTYYWDSSTGNQQDLSNCLVGEYVTYPTFGHDSGLFLWPSPPYSATPVLDDPTIINVPGNDIGITDEHIHNNFLTPYVSNVFDAPQTYRWSCPGYYNGQWVTFTNNTIERTVAKHVSLSTWYYLVTKSGYSATVDPLP